MNVTNAEYFTFNVDSSLLLVGQTGTGKSVLEDRYIERLLSSFSPDELKFVLIDMTGVDFFQIRDNHKDYIMEDVKFDSSKGLAVLEQVDTLAKERVSSQNITPLIVLCIEECDMAALNQTRFDNSLISINKIAKSANIKVIYSTSRPAPDVVSSRLLNSFDLILAGTLVDTDYEYLGVQKPKEHKKFEFVVTQLNKSNG